MIMIIFTVPEENGKKVLTMDEYINKEAAIRDLLNDSPGQVRYSREDAADCIRYMDAADVAPVRHGRWLDVREKRLFGEHYFLCSNCKSRNGLMIPFNYCPNCGAKMDG